MTSYDSRLRNWALIQSVYAHMGICTLWWNIVVLAQLSAPTDWISCLYLAQYPRLPICVLFYVQLFTVFYDLRTKGYLQYK